MTTQTATDTRSTETLGPYTLVREIGRGGMSVVHQAVDRRTGKTVALKAHTVPPSLSAIERNEVLVRFAREARAMGRLSHSGVVAIHEVGEHDGVYFLAMEYLEGETLRTRLAQGPLTPNQAAPILGHIAGALDAVHAAGVVHRDVKPSNVMLRPDGSAKLLDFGVARQSEDTTVTATHKIVGSPTYMAPEQVQGELGGPGSDVWALGVLLYEMLTGHPPFQAASIPSVLFKVIHETPPPVPHLGQAVQQVLRRALEKDPRRRYPTARALADAFTTATQTAPGRAVPAASRGRGLWIWLVAVAGLLAVVTAIRSRPSPLIDHGSAPPAAARLPAPTPQSAAPSLSAPKAGPRVAPRLRIHARRLARRHPQAEAVPAKRAPVRPVPVKSPRARRPVPNAQPQRTRSNRVVPKTPKAIVPGTRKFRRTVTRVPARLPTPALHGRFVSQRPVREARPYARSLRPRAEALPALPSPHRIWPPRRPPVPRDDKAAEQQRLQILEKYIWSEGR